MHRMLAGHGGGRRCQDIPLRVVRRHDTHEESMAISVSRYPSYRVSRVFLLPEVSCPDLEERQKSQRVIDSFRPWSVPVELGYA